MAQLFSDPAEADSVFDQSEKTLYKYHGDTGP